MAKYLYNGVELPDINEVWTDKVTYPYAVVSKDTFDESNSKYSFVLYLCSERPVTKLQDGTYHVHFAPAGSKLLISIMVTSQTLYDEMALQGHGSELGLNCWGNPLSVDTANDYNCSWIDNKIWANYDILYSDGSVYLAASDHVPVEDETTDTVTTTNVTLYIKKGSKVYKVKGTGGGLPEVVLTTPVNMGTTFTDEENVALTAALATGKPVIVKCAIMEQPDIAMTMNNFSGQGFVATYANINILLMTDGENWSAFVEELRVLPEVTEDDNGKFLQVVNGAFALVALTDVSEEGM